MTLRLGIFPNVCLLDALRWSLLGVFLTPLTALLRPPRDVYYTERQGWSFKWGEQSYSVLALCSFFLILVTLTMKAAATLLPPAPQTLPYVFREASGRYIQPLNRTDVISRGLVHTICKCGSSSLFFRLLFRLRCQLLQQFVLLWRNFFLRLLWITLVQMLTELIFGFDFDLTRLSHFGKSKLSLMTMDVVIFGGWMSTPKASSRFSTC